MKATLTKKKRSIILLAICFVGLTMLISLYHYITTPVSVDLTWADLSKTLFTKAWNKQSNQQVAVPLFSDRMKKLNGKQVLIAGYFIPMELNSKHCALSKNPNSSCFFCGGGGIETIMMVNFSSTVMNFNDDEYITVRGRLKLDSAANALIYNLDDAHYIQSN